MSQSSLGVVWGQVQQFLSPGALSPLLVALGAEAVPLNEAMPGPSHPPTCP